VGVTSLTCFKSKKLSSFFKAFKTLPVSNGFEVAGDECGTEKWWTCKCRIVTTDNYFTTIRKINSIDEEVLP